MSPENLLERWTQIGHDMRGGDRERPGCLQPRDPAALLLPGVGSDFGDLAAVAFFDSSLLCLAPAGMPRCQHPVMIIEWGQPETKLEPGARQDLLQGWDAGLTVAALDPGDLGLGDSRSLGQFLLRKAGFEPGHLEERTGGGRWSLDHVSTTVDQLSDVTRLLDRRDAAIFSA